MGGRWRTHLAVVALAVLAPAGCGCTKMDCQGFVDFKFGPAIAKLPPGAVPTACVEADCETVAPDQATARVYLSHEPSSAQTSLTIRNAQGQVVYEQRKRIKLKGYKANGRFCGTTCRTGAVDYD